MYSRIDLSHNDLQEGLRTRFADILGRDLVSLYRLPSDAPRMTVCAQVPLYNSDSDRTVYPDLAAVIRSSGVTFTAAIEIKRTAKDLLTSRDQYASYLGHSSVFFIAVPSDILHIAVCEIRDDMAMMPYMGVINACTGEIVILPQVQTVSLSAELPLLGGMARRLSQGGASELILQQDNSKAFPLPFLNIDGMAVRSAYVSIVAAVSDRLYSRERYIDLYVRRWAR